jgi:hypothetical protein
MKRFPLVSLMAAITLASTIMGCGKSVSKKGSTSFGQTEPPSEIDPVPGVGPGPGLPPGSTPVVCDPSAVAPILSYSVYAKDDVTLSHVHLRRRLAGSDACLKDTDVARGLAADGSRADVTVTHDLNLSDVKIGNGKGVYGRSFESKTSTALGGFTKVSGLDLSGEWKRVLAFSSACAAVEANATVERVCAVPPVPNGNGNDVPNGPAGEFTTDIESDEIETSASSARAPICTLKIRGTDPRLNVARLSLSHLSGVHVISLDFPSESAFVANFTRLKSATLNGIEVRLVRSYSADRIFWNLPVGETLAFNGTKFLGTVVAPRADVGVCRNVGIGAFWAESVKGSNSTW